MAALHVRCDPARLEAYNAAARAKGLPAAEWARQTLDAAVLAGEAQPQEDPCPPAPPSSRRWSSAATA